MRERDAAWNMGNSAHMRGQYEIGERGEEGSAIYEKGMQQDNMGNSAHVQENKMGNEDEEGDEESEGGTKHIFSSMHIAARVLGDFHQFFM